MFPQIKISDSLVISCYTSAILISILISLLIAYVETRRYKLPLTALPPVAFWAILAGIIGGRIFNIIFYEWEYFLAKPYAALFGNSGWMYYGSEIFGLIAVIICLRIYKLPILHPLDICGMVLFIAHSVGRVGCFLNGCCYGFPTDSFLGVKFPNLSSHVHPTQLYEAIPLFLAFIILWILRKRIQIPGLIFAIYLIIDGVQRFIGEFYRVEGYKTGILNISPSQHIAVISFFIGSILLIYVVLRFYNAKI